MALQMTSHFMKPACSVATVRSNPLRAALLPAAHQQKRRSVGTSPSAGTNAPGSQDLMSLSYQTGQLQEQGGAVKEVTATAADSSAEAISRVTNMEFDVKQLTKSLDSTSNDVKHLVSEMSKVVTKVDRLTDKVDRLAEQTSAQFTLLRTECRWQFRLFGVLLFILMILVAPSFATAIGKYFPVVG